MPVSCGYGTWKYLPLCSKASFVQALSRISTFSS